MKDLLKYLMGWEHKTPFIAALMAFITFATGEGGAALFSPSTILIADTIGGALLVIGKGIAPTGTLPKGWNIGLWVANISAILIALGSYFIGTGLFNEQFALVVVKIQTVVSGLAGAAQFYFSTQEKTA